MLESVLELLPGLLFVGLNCGVIYDSTRLNKLIERDWIKSSFAILGWEIVLYVGCMGICGIDNIAGVSIVTALIVISWLIAHKKMVIYTLSYDDVYTFYPIEKVRLTDNLSLTFKRGDVAVLGSITDNNRTFTVWCFDTEVINDFNKKDHYKVRVTDVVSSLSPAIIVSQPE